MAGYTRQTTFIDANTIEAADHNSEFNAVEAVFANTTGHSHDGTPSEGPVIGVIGDIGTTTPLNKVLIDSAPNSTLATSSKVITDPSFALLSGNVL